MAKERQKPVERSGGRLTPMTEAQEAKILTLVAACMYPAQAARLVGFTPQALSMRKKRDPEFAARLEKAESEAESGLVADIKKAGGADWRAAMALLERRFKERWSKPEVQQQLNVSNVDTDSLSKAILEGLSVIAKRHANFDEPDIDAESDD